jgi:fatty acid desaturase
MEWMRRVWQKGLTPRFMRVFNFWAMVLFAALIPPSITWWQNSVPYLVAISVWANFAGHLSAWQASRVEERQENGDDRSTDSGDNP